MHQIKQQEEKEQKKSSAIILIDGQCEGDESGKGQSDLLIRECACSSFTFHHAHNTHKKGEQCSLQSHLQFKILSTCIK